MVLIFGNNMATRKYAKNSDEPLGEAPLVTEGAKQESHDIPTTSSDGNAIHSTVNAEQRASSSVTRPNKRAKTGNSEVDSLIGAFTPSSNRLATVIWKSWPRGIWIFLMICTI
jgi:hypothetical protein